MSSRENDKRIDSEMGDDRKSSNFVKNGKVYILGDFDCTISRYVIPDFVDLVGACSGQRDAIIPMYINSFGGDAHELFGLLSAMDLARIVGVRIYTYNIGVAYSCGSLLAVSGDQRFMSKNARNLMHLGESSRIASTYEQLKRTNKDTMDFFDKIVGIYKERTKMTEAKIRKILEDDLYFMGAKECLRLGLVDSLF